MTCIIYEVKTPALGSRAPLMQTNTHNPISLTAERLLASDKVTGMIMLFLELLIDLDMPEALQVAAVNAQTSAKLVERDLLEALQHGEHHLRRSLVPSPRAHSRSCSLLWLVNRGCRPQRALSGPRWNYPDSKPSLGTRFRRRRRSHGCPP